MNTNPLRADIYKYREELALSVSIAVEAHELEKSDIYLANKIAEIKGDETTATDPFQQLADLYNLPREEIVQDIRKYANACYKNKFRTGNLEPNDIEFDQSEK